MALVLGGLPSEILMGAAQPLGEVVPQCLERREAEHARPCLGQRARDGGIEPREREGLADAPRQIAFEPGDLATQVTAGRLLVDVGGKRGRNGVPGRGADGLQQHGSPPVLRPYRHTGPVPTAAG